MKTYIILTTFVCISLFPLSPLFASNSDIDLQNAVQKLETGEPQEALDILLKKHDASSTNPQEWFLLGIAAKLVGEYEEANNYFEKLLQIDPNAHRAKLEMAEIAYRFGMNERAKQLLLDVKAANPPAGVALTIDRFIANIAAQDSQEKIGGFVHLLAGNMIQMPTPALTMTL